MPNRKNCVMPCCEMGRNDLAGIVRYAFQRNTRYQFAHSNGRTVLELATSWLAGKPIVLSIIAGATSDEQIRQNAEAVARKLAPAEFDAINLINMN